MRITPIIPLLALLALTACEDIPEGSYAGIGDPERQLVTTTETVTLELKDAQSLDQLRESLKTDTPTRAELACATATPLCTKAKTLLLKSNIPIEIKGMADGGTVTLLYRRVAAKACENRYIDNSRNNNNLNTPSVGCSIRSNMVQMVTDKQQFVNPALLDYQDGEKAAQNYQAYINPPAPAAASGTGSGNSSLIGTTGTAQ